MGRIYEDESSGLSDVDSVQGHHWRDEMGEDGEDSVTDQKAGRDREERPTPEGYQTPTPTPPVGNPGIKAVQRPPGQPISSPGA